MCREGNRRGVYIERVRVWRGVKFEWGRGKECLINDFNLKIQKVFGKYEKAFKVKKISVLRNVKGFEI